MALSQDLRDRFERLRKRLLDRRVMPFVGAGISTQARVDGDPAFEPTLTHMKQQLVARLRQELQALASSHPNGNQHEILQLFLTLICPENQACIQLQQRIQALTLAVQQDGRDTAAPNSPRLVQSRNLLPSAPTEPAQDATRSLKEQIQHCSPPDCLPLDRLAEIAGWLWGHDAVCETIQIKKFAELEPLPAHRSSELRHSKGHCASGTERSTRIFLYLKSDSSVGYLRMQDRVLSCYA